MPADGETRLTEGSEQKITRFLDSATEDEAAAVTDFLGALLDGTWATEYAGRYTVDPARSMILNVAVAQGLIVAIRFYRDYPQYVSVLAIVRMTD